MKKQEVILIVDDNQNFVDRMILLLKEAGDTSDTHIASDYDEARRMLAEVTPDIVLLDINLPGKNGIDLLRLIRKNTAHCEVIMLTNHADDYYREQCSELGAKYFLDKSNDFAQVPGLILELCSV